MKSDYFSSYLKKVTVPISKVILHTKAVKVSSLFKIV